MKKNRNCGAGMYPAYNGPMPIMGMPSPIMTGQPINPNYQTMYNQPYNNIEQKINSMEQQINSLENRVSRLESKPNTSNYSNKYNDSNYYML